MKKTLLLIQSSARIKKHCKWEFLTANKLVPDLGTSIDLKSAEKELKAVTPEKSKTCVTAFTKKLVTTLQL